MNKRNWIIVILLLHVGAAAALVVVLAVIYNRPPYPGQNPQGEAAAEAEITDERILRLEVELKAADSETRFTAISELAGMAETNSERLGPVLLRAINNEDPTVRSSAVNELGVIKYVEAAEALTILLDDPDNTVKVQTIGALAELDQAALQAIMEALAENRIKNIDAALDAATRISGRSFGLGERGRQAALKYWDQRNKQGP